MDDEVNAFFGNIGDPAQLLSGREMLLAIKNWEKTVEIIGVCISFDDSKSNLFKFVLRNDEGDRVQCLAWGNEARRWQGCIKINFVVHIDAGVARPKHTLHSVGTIPHDITVASHTLINILSKLEDPRASASPNLPVVKIEDVMDSDCGSYIVVEGHTNSTTTALPSGAGQTCIVDDVWKLEIKLQNYIKTDLTENQHIRVTGKIFNSSIPYVMVTEINNIKVTGKPALSEADLLKGTQIPKRKASTIRDGKDKTPKMET